MQMMFEFLGIALFFGTALGIGVRIFDIYFEKLKK